LRKAKTCLVEKKPDYTEIRDRRAKERMKSTAMKARAKLIAAGVPERFIVYTCYNYEEDTRLGAWIKNITDLFGIIDNSPPGFSNYTGPSMILFKITAEDCRSSKYLRKKITEGENSKESMETLESHIEKMSDTHE
jgi:hypothetical protein